MQVGLGLGVQYPVNASVGVDFCAVIDRQNIGFGVDDHAQLGGSQHHRLDAFFVGFGGKRIQLASNDLVECFEIGHGEFGF